MRYKNLGGRPPYYKTVEELDKKIEEYFESLFEDDGEGGEEQKNPATITGLAFFLGFADKCSIYDYENKPEFSHSIKRARLFVEHSYEKGLFQKNPAGVIFALKNFGWKDKHEVDASLDIPSEIMFKIKTERDED